MDSFINYIARKTVPKGRVERMIVVHRVIRSNLDGLYMCQDEGLKVTMSSCSCWRLIPSIVSYCCVETEGEDMGCVRHGVTVVCRCIRCLVSHEEFRSMNCTMIWIISET